jgi:hypothetical protein
MMFVCWPEDKLYQCCIIMYGTIIVIHPFYLGVRQVGCDTWAGEDAIAARNNADHWQEVGSFIDSIRPPAGSLRSLFVCCCHLLVEAF